ncbi:hypothetical protein AKJ45_00865, partial [candidate division MSBL1 archaeon SCGC-AAA261F19]
KYGVSLYVGIGIPIPILNENIAKTTGVGDEEISTSILDYGVPRRDRPTLDEVTYADLKSGEVELDDREVPVSPLSSIKRAKEISQVLKGWIEKGDFLLSQPVERLPRDRKFKPMKQPTKVSVAGGLMTRDVVTAKPDNLVESAAKIFAEKGFDHLPIVDEDNKLIGIVTSWDVAVAVGEGKKKLSDILTSKVVTAREDEPVDYVAQKLQKHRISGVPVIDSNKKLKGIITSEDISKLIGRGR